MWHVIVTGDPRGPWAFGGFQSEGKAHGVADRIASRLGRAAFDAPPDESAALNRIGVHVVPTSHADAWEHWTAPARDDWPVL